MTTLPANLIVRLVADVLHSRIDRLRKELERNPRRPAASAAAGRMRIVQSLAAQQTALRKARGQGDVSAEIAGLLLAWAGGHAEAIAELERLDPRVEGLESEDFVGACRLLLDAK